MSKHKEKLDQILNFAIDQKASDVHIAVGRPLIIRINSVLVFTNTENFIKEDLLGIIDVLLTFYQQEKFTKDKSINFSYSFQNRGRFRINIFFQKKNISIALRYISDEIKSFDELKLPKELKSIASFKQGLVLITGPTGQGKSTTLAAIINEINNIRNSHIITIEDPIEFIFKDNKSIISQREVFEDTHSFNDALEDTFRQDPDVIMVGEIRDKETAKLLVNAALTGHLVLSTLHTNNVVGIIPRLIDMGVDPFLIAPVFNIAMSQRLIKTLCAKCKEKKILSDQGKIIIRESLNSLFDSELKNKYLNLLEKTPYIYGPVGCLRCNKLGYSNRTAVTEILHINSEFATLITKGPTEEEIKQQTRKQQMITMQQNGMIKVLEGITTIEEVLAKTKKE